MADGVGLAVRAAGLWTAHPSVASRRLRADGPRGRGAGPAVTLSTSPPAAAVQPLPWPALQLVLGPLAAAAGVLRGLRGRKGRRAALRRHGSTAVERSVVETAERVGVLTRQAPRVEPVETLPPLVYHAMPFPGKFDIVPTKPMATQRDLSLAYSPGVAEPCIRIRDEPEAAYAYTNKGNMVACISNGTAVLGLGNIGALASKPVMEGKSVLFKKFAGVNCIDLCIDCPDQDNFVDTVKSLAPSFGGINLEDIKGPDCFHIERQLKELMPIPVFHDDQHGTAIVCLAGLINAMKISKKSIEDVKIVCNGAGAAGIACMNLLIAYGAKRENCFLCDTNGVIYPGRPGGMNEFKEALANESVTEDMTLAEACRGADVLIGVSAAGAFTEECVMALGPDPVIFAMSNPEPEIRPTEAKRLRPDCIIATGRSDFPNQINNVMCFPFLFRATLDCRAAQINEEMKMAAALALADLARQPVPEEVRKAFNGRSFEFGPEYIIPTPFDPRLIAVIPPAVARAAAETGVAAHPVECYETYATRCAAMVAP